MAQIVKACHLCAISGWSKFALLIIWVIWGPCSFILCFVNKGTCRNLWTGRQIWGGVSLISRAGSLWPRFMILYGSFACSQHLGEWESFPMSKARIIVIIVSTDLAPGTGGKGCQFIAVRACGLGPYLKVFCFLV